VGVEQNEPALMRAVDAWNAGDVDSYLELYDERLKHHAGTHDFPDKNSVGDMYRAFFAATSDLRLMIHETFGHGERLCARYTVTGRHTGDLMGMAPTGTQISITGITVMHFENGRVIERWDADDSAEIFSGLRAEMGPSRPA
jgi:predicted ester cyclase